MLMPRKVKHRKQHRGRLTGTAKGGTRVTHGHYGIQALEPGWISARQIEAARIAMTRHIKRGGKVWINVFPDKPITRSRPRPAWAPARATRALGRRGAPGRVLFELSYADEVIARERDRPGHPEAADQGQVRHP
jgi:large subunit ribosomal protein L16